MKINFNCEISPAEIVEFIQHLHDYEIVIGNQPQSDANSRINTAEQVVVSKNSNATNGSH